MKRIYLYITLIVFGASGADSASEKEASYEKPSPEQGFDLVVWGDIAKFGTFRGMRYSQRISKESMAEEPPWDPYEGPCFINCRKALKSISEYFEKTPELDADFSITKILCVRYSDKKKWFWLIKFGEENDNMEVLATWSGKIPRIVFEDQTANKQEGVPRASLSGNDDRKRNAHEKVRLVLYGGGPLPDGRKYSQKVHGREIESTESYYPENGSFPTNSSVALHAIEQEMKSLVPAIDAIEVPRITLQRTSLTGKYVYGFDIRWRIRHDSKSQIPRYRDRSAVIALTSGVVPNIKVEDE